MPHLPKAVNNKNLIVLKNTKDLEQQYYFCSVAQFDEKS